jgi:RND superfamily putative drug exporter
MTERREPLLARVGRGCHDHRWWVLGAWIVLLVVVGGLAAAKGSGYATSFSLPDVESSRGFKILEREFGGRGAGINGSIVFEADAGVNDPSVRVPMEKLFADLENLPAGLPKLSVNSPYSEQGAQLIARQGPGAGRIAYAQIEMPTDITVEQAAKVRKAMDERLPKVDGLRIEIGGGVFAEFEPPNSEALGLGFAVVVLILAFGSVMAMGLPVGTALSGIFVGISATMIISHVVEMPDFTQFVALMIGLGVGIDYALFIVTRYREELHAGRSEADATALAINTAGRAVLFAGTTVVISLMGMLIMGLAFVNGLAIGASVVVFATMVAAITLLPALLGFVGDRVEVTRWRGLIAAGLVAVGLVGAGLKIQPLLIAFPLAAIVLVASFFVRPLRQEVPHRPPKPREQTTAYRWSRIIQRHAWPAALGGVVLLLALAAPVRDLRLGFSDEGNYSPETTTRRAYDLLAEGFGPGFNGPLLLVAALPAGADPATLAKVTEAVGADPGVAFAAPAQPNRPESPTAAQWFVIPKTSPQSAETADLVERLRAQVIPAATAGTPLQVLATGGVAVNVDFTGYLASRTPIFLAVVLGLSFLLLMLVFRSIFVPLKAVIMNLLALAAAFGLIVTVFEHGTLAGVLGVDTTGPIEPFVPMMLFAIVFGLSMDYEVFLLSRIREEHVHGSPNDRAVADGLAATARVITAAAAIMVVVFGSFLLESDRIIKLFGFGLAVAVLIDATVVRMLLVPATMELLGELNWWFPRWLDRIVPRLDVEGTPREAIVADTADTAEPVTATADGDGRGDGEGPPTLTEPFPTPEGEPAPTAPS